MPNAQSLPSTILRRSARHVEDKTPVQCQLKLLRTPSWVETNTSRQARRLQAIGSVRFEWDPIGCIGKDDDWEDILNP